jgi:hypothetical protein
MKNAVFWVVAPCSLCVNDVSEDRIASILMVEESANEEPA